MHNRNILFSQAVVKVLHQNLEELLLKWEPEHGREREREGGGGRREGEGGSTQLHLHNIYIVTCTETPAGNGLYTMKALGNVSLMKCICEYVVVHVFFVHLYCSSTIVYGPWKMERDLRVNFAIFQKR